MKQERIRRCGLDLEVFSLNTVIVGSGAAGFNAADSLAALGQPDIAIVTEGMHMGTSRNTGSDKQTYYKLTLSGDVQDSVLEMARTLHGGGCMHGDIALVEAALSSRCFFKLVDIGVPFPHNRYGEYIGYKTDHDPRQRATSCGPLTSKFMTEKLENQVRQKGIRIFDGYQVIGILTAAGVHSDECPAGTPVEHPDQPRAIGLIALNLKELAGPNLGLTLFNCTNIIYATGGPAGIYLTSVYPESQAGATGIAFEAGAAGVNLTESQYGLASVKFRWNLSGTYQQVIPRYVSTSQDGGDEQEFLEPYFASPGRMLDDIFLKGYQWPFDPRKISNAGSSLIDILVYHENQVKGRRVYLDFTRNPAWGSTAGELDFTILSDETREYLAKSGALFGTPVQRLQKMNRPAIDLYRDHGIDLTREYLEIAVCAQHNNGGLMGNIWWESNLRHFFPAGEANGTFGVYRPGGSALNSTQVGSLRAAQYINANYRAEPAATADLLRLAGSQIDGKIRMALSFAGNAVNRSVVSNVLDLRKKYQQRMTRAGAQVRSLAGVSAAIRACRQDLRNFVTNTTVADVAELGQIFMNRDILMTQLAYLSAIQAYIEKGGRSRGSYLVQDSEGELPAASLPEEFRFSLDRGDLLASICEIRLSPDNDQEGGYLCSAAWQPVRPIPTEDNWFENVWSQYRRQEIIR